MKWCSRWLGPLALLAAACSGASESDVLGPATAQSSSPTEPSPSNGAAPSGGAPSGTTGGGDGAGTSDAGAADGGEACTREVEPNDDIDEATPFTSRLCGRIASRNDVDYATFVVPENAETLSYKLSESGGNVALHVYVNGAPLPIATGQIRAIPNATYQFEMRLSQSGSAQDRPAYTLDVVAE